MNSEELQDYVRQMHQQESEAEACGEELARSLLQRIHVNKTKSMSIALGAMLSVLDKVDEKNEQNCTPLLHQWSIDEFWKYKLYSAYSKFQEIYNKLAELKASFDNRLIYGDIDYGAWVGKFEAEEFHSERNYVAVECYCSCADDNVHIFYGNEVEFNCRTVTPEKAKEIIESGTFKQYGDDRDPGYCFSLRMMNYTNSPLRLETKDTLFVYSKVQQALWTLYHIEDGIIDPLHFPREL